jgi:hypothetical protein
MKCFTPLLVLFAVLLASLATPAYAAITDYTSDASGFVSDVTVDGVTHNTSALINGTLTGYVDANAVQLLVGEGGSVPAPGSRAGLLSDLSLSTGPLNTASITFAFDAAVANGSGIDLLIWDWGAFNGDTFSITINGTTFNNLTNSDGSLPAGGDYYQGPGRISDWFGSDSSDGVNTVAEMEALAFTGSKTDSSASSQGVIGLELDAFGVASGGSISEVTISGGSVTVDPTLILGIYAVPEPTTFCLAAFGLLGLIGFGRRRKR